jgi:hypothetical protein
VSVDRLRLTPKEREAVEVQIMSDGVTVWVWGGKPPASAVGRTQRPARIRPAAPQPSRTSE